jgi:hypothetical protein
MRQEFDTPTLETIYLVQTTAFTFGGLCGPVPRRPLVRAVEGKNEERLAMSWTGAHRFKDEAAARWMLKLLIESKNVPDWQFRIVKVEPTVVATSWS